MRADRIKVIRENIDGRKERLEIRLDERISKLERGGHKIASYRLKKISDKKGEGSNSGNEGEFCCQKFSEGTGSYSYFTSRDNLCGISPDAACAGSCPTVTDKSFCEDDEEGDKDVLENDTEGDDE